MAKSYYRQGQVIKCTVNYAEKNGYAVTVGDEKLPGFIKTDDVHKRGDVLSGVFVCVHNGRILLSQLFSSPGAVQEQLGKITVDWEKHLSEDDCVSEESTSRQDRGNQADRTPDKGVLDIAKIRHQRACDLFMPPVDLRSIRNLKTFKIADYDLQWLITDLEGGSRTACIKTASKNQSRSAALLYKGRVVGCFHQSKETPLPGPTAAALAGLLSDLDQAETNVTIYDLPEEIVFSMSALFLGTLLNMQCENTASDHYDSLMENLTRRKKSACLTILAGYPVETRLVLVHRGQLIGVFNVEDQLFFRDENSLNDLFDRFPQAVIEARVAGNSNAKSVKHYGYSLSEANELRQRS